MDNEEAQQKEFFEFEDRPKKKFSSFGKIFQKNDFENRYLFTLNPERLVFVAIGVIMLLVLVYALGVERGKSITRITNTAQETLPAATPIAKPQAAVIAAELDSAEAEALPTAKIEKQTAFHTIVACTFTQEATAAAEANRLKSEGIDAYIYQSGSYYLVCVGRFADSTGAKDELLRVRRYFKDAYVKKREQ